MLDNANRLFNTAVPYGNTVHTLIGIERKYICDLTFDVKRLYFGYCSEAF